MKHDGKLYYFSYKNQESVDMYNVVINATGAKSHLNELDQDDQLIKNLENRQIVKQIQWEALQIIKTNQVISPRFGTLTNMIAIGQMTNGVNKLRKWCENDRNRTSCAYSISII